MFYYYSQVMESVTDFIFFFFFSHSTYFNDYLFQVPTLIVNYLAILFHFFFGFFKLEIVDFHEKINPSSFEHDIIEIGFIFELFEKCWKTKI